MPEKSIPERLDDCEEIQKTQQTELQQHGAKLRELEELRERLKQLDSLSEDFALLIKHCKQAQHSILDVSTQNPGMRHTPSEIEQCDRFVAK